MRRRQTPLRMRALRPIVSKNISGKTNNQSKKHKTTFWIAVDRIVLIATLISIIVAFIVAYQEYKSDAAARSAARQTNLENALSTNWLVLTSPSVGSGGKVEALRFLADHGQSLEGIDISCERMGGPSNWNSQLAECELPVRLSDQDFQFTSFTGVNFSGVRIRDMRFSDLSFKDAVLVGSDLRGVTFENVNFYEALLMRANLAGATFRGGTLMSAELNRANLAGTTFTNTNLSRTDFTGAIAQHLAVFEKPWAFEGHLPIGMTDLSQLVICPIERRQIYNMPRPEDC